MSRRRAAIPFILLAISATLWKVSGTLRTTLATRRWAVVLFILLAISVAVATPAYLFFRKYGQLPFDKTLTFVTKDYREGCPFAYFMRGQSKRYFDGMGLAPDTFISKEVVCERVF